VLSGDMPRLNPECERGSSTFGPFEVDMADWDSCCGRETTPFVLLLPPLGLNRELLFLVRDLSERFGFEE
jgi:hypothetical protein